MGLPSGGRISSRPAGGFFSRMFIVVRSLLADMRYLIPCGADRRFSRLACGNESLSRLGQTDIHTSGSNVPPERLHKKARAGLLC